MVGFYCEDNSENVLLGDLRTWLVKRLSGNLLVKLNTLPPVPHSLLIKDKSKIREVVKNKEVRVYEEK